MHFLSNEEKEKWIEDYLERETAGARKRVKDAEAAVQQQRYDTRKAGNAGLTSREPAKTFQEMIVGIGAVLVILQVPMMGRMRKMRIMKRQSRAS